ncbi:RAB6-interacting golgin isoform X3 [Esox lucius]|nr:RAB6-interacting golgin isoform X3 [Esox lucius]XP_019904294.1 RAB6-interacting golgin isoform X3 [Esox lucius]
MIEERNKRKKALLTKTIAEKSKQTHAEAVKLKRIQKELQTLDNMVSSDIGILRGVIEQASMDYNAARKRYEKAEAEYVTAKLDLHKKTDVKEQLTEHLCAIIQQNELRKAHKLEELLQQLHLQTAEEEPEGEERGRPAEDRGATKVQEESKNAVLASPVNGSTPGTEKETQAGSTTLLPVCPAVTVTEPNGRDQNSKPSNGPLAGQCEVPASPS